MLKVFCVEMNEELDRDQFKILLEKVDGNKRAKINRYHFYHDSVRSLIGDLLVRYCINFLYHINNDDIAFEYSTYGKPLLKNFKEIYFNISHSGCWIVCGVGDMDIGIDVECIKDINLEIADRFFNEKETRYLESLKKEDKLRQFYKIWTMKEAYIKGRGKGLFIPLESFCVKERHNHFSIEYEKAWNLYNLYISENYCLSVATKCISAPERMDVFTIREFANKVISHL